MLKSGYLRSRYFTPFQKLGFRIILDFSIATEEARR
jgi:hypothetical protein